MNELFRKSYAFIETRLCMGSALLNAISVNGFNPAGCSKGFASTSKRVKWVPEGKIQR